MTRGRNRDLASRRFIDPVGVGLSPLVMHENGLPWQSRHLSVWPTVLDRDGICPKAREFKTIVGHDP